MFWQGMCALQENAITPAWCVYTRARANTPTNPGRRDKYIIESSSFVQPRGRALFSKFCLTKLNWASPASPERVLWRIKRINFPAKQNTKQNSAPRRRRARACVCVDYMLNLVIGVCVRGAEVHSAATTQQHGLI